eukprot:6604181-Pyramimonas_sp.AAC.1
MSGFTDIRRARLSHSESHLERFEIAWAEQLIVLWSLFPHYILSGSSTSPPAVRKVDGLPPAPSIVNGTPTSVSCEVSSVRRIVSSD